MAGDVATTGTAAADVTQSDPERGESAVPGQDTEVAREAAAPRRARPRPARDAGSPGTSPDAAPSGAPAGAAPSGAPAGAAPAAT
ncbi:MAG TPA: hypothetical protein VG142_09525, partial [Trebonia sp.]|nr:hypothetical protein [Trebonia sp.]